MRRLIKLALLAITIFVLPVVGLAQSTGEWRDCIQPRTGALTKCYVQRRVTPQTVSQTTVTQNQNIVVVQPVIINTPAPVTESRRPLYYSDLPNGLEGASRRYYYYDSPRYRETRLAEDQVEVPYYENQERRTVRQRYGGGLDRWSGRPYGHYEVQTEKVYVRAEANSLTFRPTISISTNSWPSYYNWD